MKHFTLGCVLWRSSTPGPRTPPEIAGLIKGLLTVGFLWRYVRGEPVAQRLEAIVVVKERHGK